MSIINATPLLAAAGGDYQISRSVRLRSSASGWFSRTPSGAGNQSTWTWSGWVKRGSLGSSYQMLFGADSGGGGGAALYFFNDNLCFGQFTSTYRVSTAVYRDPSAWYHVVCVLDTTQATANNRVRIYVNGVEVTAFGTLNNPTQNSTLAFNGAVNHAVGADIPNSGARNFLDGYLTEINFVNAQALTPSSFGETDTITGVWKPKRYTGTYGTNGFYLNFSDPSAATAAAIGADRSGNGNNWTPNNISVTVGVTYDSMLDVPTPYADGGNGRGNYAVLNPLAVTPVAATFAEANLKVTTANAGGNAFGTIAIPSSGKWYWEVTAGSGTSPYIGISAYLATQTYAWSNTNSVFYVGSNGNKSVDGTASAYGSTYTTNDVIGVAVDVDSGTITFYKNNTSQGSISHTFVDVYPCLADGASATSDIFYANFGQRPFAYTPPTGFRALNTQNLPESTIKKGNQWFDATTYTGTGAQLNVTNSGAMQPDLVWLKARSSAFNNLLTDSVRGTGLGLISNSTAAEASNGMTAFSSNGFQVQNNSETGANGVTYVAWQWKESASAGFDIVTYTGTGSGTTVSHSLGVAPKMMIVKQRSASGNYFVVWMSGVTSTTQSLWLGATNAILSTPNYWNSTAPTSSVFSVGNDSATNGSGSTYVAYLFAEVAGFSRFGSYTGNAASDGPFVYCGFRPKYILIKGTATGRNWVVFDSSRNTYNINSTALARLKPNTSDAEDGNEQIDFLSNGFKLRAYTFDGNASGETYIFAAFAENPFKNSLAR